jgi:phosphate/sulfate permease
MERCVFISARFGNQHNPSELRGGEATSCASPLLHFLFLPAMEVETILPEPCIYVTGFSCPLLYSFLTNPADWGSFVESQVTNPFFWLLLCGCAAAFSLAWSIGANDIANAMGPAIGSGAVPYRRGILIASTCEFLGVVLMGGAVSNTIREGIISPSYYQDDPNVYMLGMFSAVMGSFLWLLMASSLSMPVSSTQAVVGAVVGFAVATAGWSYVNLWTIASIVISWITSPLLAGTMSCLLFVILKSVLLIPATPEALANDSSSDCEDSESQQSDQSSGSPHSSTVSQAPPTRAEPEQEISEAVSCNVTTVKSRLIKWRSAIMLAVLWSVTGLTCLPFALYRASLLPGIPPILLLVFIVVLGTILALAVGVITLLLYGIGLPALRQYLDTHRRDEYTRRWEIRSAWTLLRLRAFRYWMPEPLHESSSDTLALHGPPLTVVIRAEHETETAVDVGEEAPKTSSSIRKGLTRSAPLAGLEHGSLTEMEVEINLVPAHAQILEKKGHQKVTETENANGNANTNDNRMAIEDVAEAECGPSAGQFLEGEQVEAVSTSSSSSSPVENSEKDIGEEEEEEEEYIPPNMTLQIPGQTAAYGPPRIASTQSTAPSRHSTLRLYFPLLPSPLEDCFVPFNYVTAALLAFAHGANDVSNAIGPFIAMVTTYQTGSSTEYSSNVPLWILILGGIGICLGLVMYGGRVMRTVGSSITTLSPSKAFVASVSTTAALLTGTLLGIPISTTQTLVGAVIGVGIASGKPLHSVQLKTVRSIVMAWLVTLPVAFCLSAGVFVALRSVGDLSPPLSLPRPVWSDVNLGR